MPELSEDQKLLIRIDTNLKNLVDEFKEYKRETNAILLSKFDSKDFAETWGKQIVDHEARLRGIEKYVWKAIGIVGLIEIIGGAFIIELLKK
jgi:hypothetical protein